ncbi:lipase family protein [Spirochaeta isovalerica]|uniref:Secretory lipase n=1 Tax=Spirochaeta isovalerica TaxID=150 RepID=A0A841RHZ2_9SPIO|nr:lipase family protein [Spirochaeta isovalerica]MBB6482379.1 hypothetical protein [Spirochaeta isovalerica]
MKSITGNLFFLLILPFILLSFSCSGNKSADIEQTVENQTQVQVEPQPVAEEPQLPLPGDITLVEKRKVYSLNETVEAVKPFIEDYAMEPLQYGVRTYHIRFVSTDFDGSQAIIHAQLFIPDTAVDEDFPLYVFGSGTTGISDACAPSFEVPELRRWGWYKQNMLAYGGSGFIAVFPDYLGFNDPDRPQRYFSKLAEGHVMLDSIRAVKNLFETEDFSSLKANLSGQTFTAGYSQGGHAAFAAADLLSEYAPEIDLTGVIGYASTNDIAALFREGVCYGAEIIYTYMKMYGEDKIDPADYLQERFLETFEEDASTMCVDVFQYYFGYDSKKLFNEDFYRSLYTDNLAEDYPVMHKYMAMNNTGLSGHGIPSFVVQGGTDFIITTASADIFVDGLRELGSEVKYEVYPGIPHKYTRMAGFADSIEWMRSFGE